MKKTALLASLLLASARADVPEYYRDTKVQDIIVIPTRHDQKIAYKWLADSQNNSAPLILSMNGGHGKWKLRDSHITPSRIGTLLANFNDYRIVSVDMPIDEYQNPDGGYGSESYRTSLRQIEDIRALLQQINPSDLPVYIFTTSKSTLSGINASASDIPNLKGVILSAISADLAELAPKSKVKTLWIHHAKDECYRAGLESVKNVAASAPHSTFVTVVNSADVSGKACSMSNYHGFVGRDNEIARNIDAWIQGKRIQNVIQ